VALFLAALITLTGCPTSVDDDDSSGTVFTHRIYGQNVDPYQAQEAIDNAYKAGEAIVLEHNLVIQAGQRIPVPALNFRNVQVRVNGIVYFDYGVINVADASVSWAPGSRIEMPNGGVFILREGQKTDATGHVPARALVEYVDRVQDIQSTSFAAAVRDFRLGPKQNHDYSVDPNGVDARITNENLTELYVVGTLSVPSEATPLSPDLGIIPLDTLDATGTIPVNVVQTNLWPGTSSTLTSSRGVTITWWNGPITIPNVRVEAEKGITLLQDSPNTQPLTIEGKLTGPGTLTFGATDITINGGDGNFIATGGIPGAPISRELSVYSTGTALFAGDVTIPAGGLGSVIHSNVTFKGNVIANDSLALQGNVSLGQAGQTITIAAAKDLILGKGKTITAQIEPPDTTQIIPAPLLTAVDADVVLHASGTPVILTTPARPKKPEDVAKAKAILVNGAGLGNTQLQIVDGTLQVLPEASLSIGTATTGIELYTNINGSGKVFGYLAVAAGGTFSLANNNQFTIGYNDNDDNTAYINGPFTFTAAGGTIKLGYHRIAGSAPGTKLAPVKGTNGSITVAESTGTLALDQVELDVAVNGSVRLESPGSRVSLDNGAKIILLPGENGQPTPAELSTIKLAGTTTTTRGAQLTGAFLALTAPDDTKYPAWSVAHKGGQLAEVNITVIPTNTGGDVILGKGGKPVFSSR
jgi:hypothetical protein